MLNREDSRRLAQMERQLRLDDPEFCARMEGGRPATGPVRRRFPMALILTATVILIAAVGLAVVGWWIAAAIAAFWATVVVAAMLTRARRLGKP